ncbi:MAG: HypC/HybG/HupF family hydrogenase formation chaperone [Planctomycetota bacterium]|jgi:hydrogenase expression/formation protein HypC
MCLAVPGKIVAVQEDTGADDPAVTRTATVDFQGNQIQASLAAVPEAAVGNWVLVHAGFAITIMDEDEARETFESIAEAIGDVPLPGAE